MHQKTHAPTDSTTLPDYWRRLMHRWLVEYNPLYLLSAALVLAGMTVISRELALANGLYAQLGVAAIAEVYAWALIGGAALLQRISLRRPAVMLVLLTVLYQGDLALHTETCAYLGGVGIAASVVWLASFAAKVEALAWAIEARLSRTARVILLVGASGLAAFPYSFHHVSPAVLSAWVTLWLFVLFASRLWTGTHITSKRALDATASVVFGRATLATWSLWGTLAVAHVLFWSSEGEMSARPLIVGGMLLTTRFFRREWVVWFCVGATLFAVAVGMPSFLWAAALMATAVLLLRAKRLPVRQADGRTQPSSEPYRTHPHPPGASLPPPVRLVFQSAPTAALHRLFAGAALTLYLAVWTHGWTGGAWPNHGLIVDGAFTLLFVVMTLRGMRLALAPMSAIYLHLGVQVGLIALPQTTMAWGATAVATGFVLLAGSLLYAWYLQRDRASPQHPRAP